MTAKIPLMPAESASATSLHTIVAVMSFLACLTLGAVITLGYQAHAWTQGLTASVTVQLVAAPDITPEDQAEKALAIIQSWPGIFRTKLLSQAEAGRLLEPWLGSGNVISDLPVPQLIEVTLSTGGKTDLVGLGQALKDGVPGAELDDHQRWNQELAAFARSSTTLGWVILLLLAVATLAVVAFATQAGLQAHRDIVEVVHMIGARDEFIAAEFQKHFLVLGLRGGLVGMGAALITMLVIAWSLDSRAAPGGAQFLPQLLSSPWRYIWLLLIPIISAFIAMYAARLTVLRVIGRML